MEKTRVKKGEKYWYIDIDYEIDSTIEALTGINNRMFESGNYFSNYSEAEACAEKIRKVLKGADVIEMPSEEKIKAKIEYIAEKYQISYHEEDDIVVSFGECYESAEYMFNWLKSKIVK